MPNLYASKRPHGLHRCTDTATFRAAFEAQLGRGLSAFMDEFVPEHVRRSTVLVGSIAEGIANEVSDIDLMVVVTQDGVEEFSVGKLDGDVSVKIASRGGLELAIVSGVFSGLEIDVALISGPRLAALCTALGRGGVALRDDEVRVVSRLRRGWALECDILFPTEFSALYVGDALELYCATNAYTIALKRLEDAFAAVEKDDVLALHLGRLAVEQAYFAYLASHGHCAPSVKWTSLLRHRSDEPVLDDGLRLLFPALAGDVGNGRRYLAEVRHFVEGVRIVVTRDVSFQIAFDFCPQVYEPNFATASVG